MQGLIPTLRHFGWSVFALGVFAAAVGHWLALSLLHIVVHVMGFPEYSWTWNLAVAMVALLTTFVAAVWLYFLHHKNPRPQKPRDNWLQLAIAWLVFASGLWFAVSFEKVLLVAAKSAGFKPYLTVAFIGAIGLIAFSSKYARLRDKVQGVRDIAQKRGESAHIDTLIIFVSTPNIVPLVSGINGDAGTARSCVSFSDENEARLMSESIDDDIAAIAEASQGGPPWNWQQILRALAPYEELRCIWLIGSEDASFVQKQKTDGEAGEVDYLAPGQRWFAQSGIGSQRYLELCEAFVRPYTDAKIERHSLPLNFENFEEVYEAVNKVLQKLHKERPDIDPEKIMVDVTGGMKVTSIVGAMLTLNRGTRFQYVETQPDFSVIPYQLVHDQAPSPHGH